MQTMANLSVSANEALMYEIKNADLYIWGLTIQRCVRISLLFYYDIKRTVVIIRSPLRKGKQTVLKLQRFQFVCLLS